MRRAAGQARTGTTDLLDPFKEVERNESFKRGAPEFLAAALAPLLRSAVRAVRVNAGPMITAGGDYYGRAVNIAAQAAPGDVLVGETALCAEAGVRFECVGPMHPRGVAQDVTVYRAFAAA